MELMEKQLATLSTQVEHLRDDFDEVKFTLKSLEEVIRKFSGIEEKLLADKETRKLMWEKVEHITDVIAMHEIDFAWLKEHKATYMQHCKLLDWVTQHQKDYEMVQDTILSYSEKLRKMDADINGHLVTDKDRRVLDFLNFLCKPLIAVLTIVGAGGLAWLVQFFLKMTIHHPDVLVK